MEFGWTIDLSLENKHPFATGLFVANFVGRRDVFLYNNGDTLAR